MRFRKGSKVEVFSQTEVPSGSWICAKILSGNGHNYDIMYDCSPGVGSTAVVDRVSRKIIRPCPPPVDTVKDWVVGDIVEVFDNVSWKMATVSKVMSGGYFLVRLLGSDREFKAHKSDLRVRQSWKDDEWVVVGKGFGNSKDAKYNKLSTLKSYQQSSTHFPIGDRKMKVHGGDKRFHVEDSAGFQDCHMVYSRNLKRGPSYNLSYAEPYVGAAHKVRAIEEAGRRQRIVPMRISLLKKKVDDVASPHNKLGEKQMHASFCNQTGLSEMNTERTKPSGDVGSFVVRRLECNDAENSCVGSCSITSDSPYRLGPHSSTNPSLDLDSDCTDAESFCGPGHDIECPLPTKEDLAAELHKMELHAYHCTISALYASGPLSWEQEALMTNLRLMLHISNDEHLMEGQSWRLVLLASKGQKMMVGFATFLLVKTMGGISAPNSLQIRC